MTGKVSGGRFVVLDSFRGLSALLVAIFHFHAYGHFYNVDFIRNSYLFVDFFFTLSGFVIAYGYSDKITGDVQGSLNFLRRRIGRVYPLHVFCIAFLLLLEVIKWGVLKFGVLSVEESAFSGSYSLESLLSNLIFFQAFGLHDGLTWNGPSWSVAVEFWVYLVFSIVCLFFYRYVKFLSFVLSIIGLGFLVVYVGSMSATVDYGFFRCLHGFFLGVIVYFIRKIFWKHCLVWPTLSEVVVLVAVFVFVTYWGRGGSSLFASWVFSAVVFIFSYEQGLVSRFLKMRFFIFLGLISYSIYMMHSLLLAVFGKASTLFESVSGVQLFVKESHLIPEGGGRWLFYYHSPWVVDVIGLIYLVLLIGISALTYKLVEYRFRSIVGGVGNVSGRV